MLKQRIQEVLRRVERACDRSGRDAKSITLVAVTKTFPVDVVEEACRAGIRHFGENRVQELTSKSASLPGNLNNGDVFWHMIGHIQRNKAKDVIGNADFVHSLDSIRLAKELNKRAELRSGKLPCMVQVNVSGEDSKFGLEPSGLIGFMEKVISFPNLEITGLMTLAAQADDPEDVRPQFVKLRSLRDKLIASDERFSKMTQLSMGMSGDFEVAIEEGATHIRIGSLIFGSRA